MRKVVIIGSGFSGVLSATELLRNTGNAEITLLERYPEQVCAGVAYGASGPVHETNIAAKNMGFEKGGAALCAFSQANPDKVMTRKGIGAYLDAELKKAAQLSSSTYRTVIGAAADINDTGKSVTVTLESGEELVADKVIVATGNHEVRELPCLTQEHSNDPAFTSRYVGDQWAPESRQKIGDIPPNAPVLIIGTALSGYDSARSLLRQGHTGPIVMMSRHGLEHFQYPENHKWEDIHLPRPRFLRYPYIIEPEAMVSEMVKEFRELTGLKVDPYKGTVERESFLRRQWNGDKNYLPEQVLKQWEKHIPDIVNQFGVKQYGRAIERFSALINVLRVGAGHSICEEIKAAKKSGQLKVVPANIHGFEVAPEGGLSARYTPSGAKAPQRDTFHTVISSLGPNHDYSKTRSPLWRSLFERGYTEPHPVGVGVKVAGDQPGRLPGSANIYAVGTSVAGHRMITKGILGPPAFSIPGMRDDISETARGVALALEGGQLTAETRIQPYPPSYPAILRGENNIGGTRT